METKVCNKCGTEHPVSYFYKNATKSQGVQGECKDCWREYDATQRMYVNGKRINKDHPLWKPGRYKTWDDPWSHAEIDKKTKSGDVYIIRNTAWPDWYKVGKALEAEDRLRNYQTSSPHRDFVLCHSQIKDTLLCDKLHPLLGHSQERIRQINSYDPVIAHLLSK